MTTIEEILRRRMRLPVPTVKTPVTPMQLGGLAIPFLWGMIYPTDRFAVLLHVQGTWFYELLSFLTAVAIFLALIFSPRDDIVPWEKVPEPRQRIFFFAACGVSLAGVALLGLTGGGFWTYIYLALAVLTLLWLVLPYLVLSGNPGALRLLLFSMRMGMVWFTSMFLILAIKDGSGQIMNNSLPAVALGFLGGTYWCFLLTANRLSSDEAGEWPVFFPGWGKCYWTGLLLSGCLVFLWVLTGFTNDGSGQYGAAAYNLSFPFYDVAAFLEPFSFSNGPLLLLHAIPWQEMISPGSTTGEGSLLHMLSLMHWLGLACLAVAFFGAFAAFFSGMFPRVAIIYGVLAAAISAATAFQVVSVWQEFALRGWEPDHCPHPPDALHGWDCASSSLGGLDNFMLMRQHIPALVCCVLALALAAAFLALLVKSGIRRQPSGKGQLLP